MTWIFAYGTLMGDNGLRYYEGTPAQLHGFHRAFHHASTLRWGTPERPCPVLGLSPGGTCHGVAFEIPRRDRRDILRILSRREGREEYRRRRVPVRLQDGRDVKALAWVTKPGVLKRPRWPDGGPELVEAFRRAHGTAGTGIEYVRTLVHAMERWGIEDPLITDLWKVLQPYSNPGS